MKDGMTSRGVCCQAPALECHLVEKASVGEDAVHVSHLRSSLKAKQANLAATCSVSARPAGGAVLSIRLDHD